MIAVVEKKGEFAGWSTWGHEPFEYETAGPFYFKRDSKGVACAFRAERKHLNAAGVIHGGCLMTFADFSLYAFAESHLEPGSYPLTIGFTCEFLDGAREGERVEARGEVLKAGRSLLFVRGVVTAAERPCLNYSGTIKKVKRRA